MAESKINKPPIAYKLFSVPSGRKLTVQEGGAGIYYGTLVDNIELSGYTPTSASIKGWDAIPKTIFLFISGNGHSVGAYCDEVITLGHLNVCVTYVAV